MKPTARILWMFYRKILPASVAFSGLAAVMSGFSMRNFGLCFLLIFPLLHYFVYELRLAREYYFYANFGWTRLKLWCLTLSAAVVFKLIFSWL